MSIVYSFSFLCCLQLFTLSHSWCVLVFATCSSCRGVAVEMTEPLFDSPPLSAEELGDIGFLQNLPSILTSHVLAPQPGDTVLDMCASPGNLCTHTHNTHTTHTHNTHTHNTHTHNTHTQHTHTHNTHTTHTHTHTDTRTHTHRHTHTHTDTRTHTHTQHTHTHTYTAVHTSAQVVYSSECVG